MSMVEKAYDAVQTASSLNIMEKYWGKSCLKKFEDFFSQNSSNKTRVFFIKLNLLLAFT